MKRSKAIAVYGIGMGMLGAVSTATSPGYSIPKPSLPVRWINKPIRELSVQEKKAMLRALQHRWNRLEPILATSANAAHTRLQIEAATKFSRRESKHEIRSIDFAVSTIRTVFSLQMKELASVLAVERPTVYAWIRKERQPQQHNLSRITELLSLVDAWKRSNAGNIGTAVRTFVDEKGKSLLQLLSEPKLDTPRIRDFISKIVLNEKPHWQKPFPARHGVKHSKTEIDVLTGKPFPEA